MGHKVTLGGERLGAGKRQKVYLHGFERSTHNLGYLWRSTMAAGTLVPFMSKVLLPGDSFDIHLECDMKTHPTTGPLFGSYKVQLDVFLCPIRLYQGLMHNNKLNIGLKMSNVKLPLMKLFVDADQKGDYQSEDGKLDNVQINPSCILSYLGIRGVGMPETSTTGILEREFQGIPLLAYWDIYKNYYSNKPENIGAVIHNTNTDFTQNVTAITFGTDEVGVDPVSTNNGELFTVTISGGTFPPDFAVILQTTGGELTIDQAGDLVSGTATVRTYRWKAGPRGVYAWRYAQDSEIPPVTPTVVTFPLESLDSMREAILTHQITTAFDINAAAAAIETTGGLENPYNLLLNWEGGKTTYTFSQQGLGLKTYQSDLFNNWLDSELFDPDNPDSITALTTVDTTSGGFTIDSLAISQRVWKMLNRIAVSGGTYNDWIQTIWDIDRYTNAETPVYLGGLIKELVFQEVVSNSEAGTDSDQGAQPLGTLAGRGVMANKNKGGNISAKTDEPAYLIGIISLTPRIDYSQGNDWDVHLKTMDDLHKPQMDEIGFQELITEQMAWWDTTSNAAGDTWIQKSAGKQPAWTNYMTSVNKTYGNFAIQDNEMFMTLNRMYEPQSNAGGIRDLTTYIDPVKGNQIFADTALDAQNFWAQIAVDITARRKMSAKVMPNI